MFRILDNTILSVSLSGVGFFMNCRDSMLYDWLIIKQGKLRISASAPQSAIFINRASSERGWFCTGRRMTKHLNPWRIMLTLCDASVHMFYLSSKKASHLRLFPMVIKVKGREKLYSLQGAHQDKLSGLRRPAYWARSFP